MYVENLSIFVVRDTAEVLALLKLGKKKLIIGETRMNRFSSRYYCGSHMLYGSTSTVWGMITRFEISNFLDVIFAFIIAKKTLTIYCDLLTLGCFSSNNDGFSLNRILKSGNHSTKTTNREKYKNHVC